MILKKINDRGTSIYLMPQFVPISPTFFSPLFPDTHLLSPTLQGS